MNFLDKTKVSFDKSCLVEHNPPEKQPKRKLFKSSLGILIERTRLSNKIHDFSINNFPQTPRNQSDLLLSKKKINEILMIMQAVNKDTNKTVKKPGIIERKKSICPFLTKFGDNDQLSILSNKKGKNCFEIVNEKMRSKLGNDFYNKIKVNLMLSNQKNAKDLENFQKFQKKKRSKLLTNDKINIRKNIYELPILTEPLAEEKDINLKEYQKNFLIDSNDELFQDYKLMKLKKAQKLLNNTPNYRAILSSEILRFPGFMKKLETESNNSSFLDNYCPLESLKDINGKCESGKKRDCLPKIHGLKKRKNKNNDSCSKKGDLTERYEGKMEEIEENLKGVKKNNRTLKRKVRREAKSLNFKFGNMIKNLEGLKLF